MVVHPQGQCLFSTANGMSQHNVCDDSTQGKNYAPQMKRPRYAYFVKGQLLSIANPQANAVDTNILKVAILSFILTL